MRPYGFILCAIAALAMGPALAPLGYGSRAASASTFIELSVADLVARASLVVTGTPLESSSVWESSDGARGKRIVTYTRVQIDRVFDGKPPGEVWVRTLGGQVGDIGQHVDGEAVLVPARPALMFLAARADGTHAVVGMGQGHYPLETRIDQPVRVSVPQGGHLVEKLNPAQIDHPPARSVLPGCTLDEVAQLIGSARRLHAP
jgi:hypothetical protein